MKFLMTLLAAVTLGTLSLGASAAGMAEVHASKGMPCTTRHKTPQTMPTTDDCTKCHAKDALVKSTAAMKPTNPHTSPHYNADLDCVNCHVGHAESVDFCGQCHSFNFKVP